MTTSSPIHLMAIKRYLVATLIHFIARISFKQDVISRVACRGNIVIATLSKAHIMQLAQCIEQPAHPMDHQKANL